MPEASPVLELADVVKDYPVRRGLLDALRAPFGGSVRRVLHGVSLRVDPGEVVVLLGPNGAGKSTSLSILAGLVLPTSGAARVGGIDASREPARAHARLGHVGGDDRGFYPRLDVAENLRFFAALHGLAPAAAEERIRELGATLGFSAQLRQPFGTLSTGQKARVALARALAHQPPALLLDEVGRSLDPGARERLRRLVVDELAGRRRIGVLFTTHDLDEARQIATRVAVLVEGRIVAGGAWADVEPAIDRAFFADVTSSPTSPSSEAM